MGEEERVEVCVNPESQTRAVAMEARAISKVNRNPGHCYTPCGTKSVLSL